MSDEKRPTLERIASYWRRLREVLRARRGYEVSGLRSHSYSTATPCYNPGKRIQVNEDDPSMVRARAHLCTTMLRKVRRSMVQTVTSRCALMVMLLVHSYINAAETSRAHCQAGENKRGAVLD